MADIHACLAVRGHQEHMTSSVAHHEKQRRSSAGLDRKETNLRVPRNDAVTVSSEQLILRRQQEHGDPDTHHGLTGRESRQAAGMADIHACLAVRGHQEHMTSSVAHHEKQRLRPQQEEIRMRMVSSRFSASGMYDEVACKIALRLQNGHDVAVVRATRWYTALFGIFSRRLHKTHRVVVVPGVSSLTQRCRDGVE